MSEKVDLPQMLAHFLGVEPAPSREERSLGPKKAAFKRFIESLKGDDLEEQMAAYDDYQLFAGDEDDGEIEESDGLDS